MKEVISIHIGQAGMRIGETVCEQLCSEHDISMDGKMDPKSYYSGADNAFLSMFSESVN